MTDKTYDTDFNIILRPIHEIMDELREEGKMKFGTQWTPQAMHKLLRIPFLSPRAVGEKRRFNHIATVYVRERQKLRKVIREQEAMSLEFIDTEGVYQIVHPSSIVAMKRTRINRSVTSLVSDAHDSVVLNKGHMNKAQKAEADGFLEQLVAIETAILER